MKLNRKTKKEIWLPCPGYERWYDISNHGNIRSYHSLGGNLRNGGVHKEGVRKIEPKQNKTHYSPSFGYLHCVLSKGIGVPKSMPVHILVAKAFVPNPFNRKHVHHKDNDKRNPCAWNLKWVTPGQNQKLAYKDGQRKRPNGTSNGRCKLTEAQVLEIFNCNGNHYKLANKYGVSRPVIDKIRNGKLWSSLTGKVYEKPKIKTLPKKIVLAIYNHKGNQYDIAKKFGTRQPVVSAIKTGRSYSGITGAVFTGNKIYKYD